MLSDFNTFYITPASNKQYLRMSNKFNYRNLLFNRNDEQ